MLEERAIVSRIETGRVWVRSAGPQSCPRCAAGEGCGGGVLARLVSRRHPEVETRGTLAGLCAGDGVIVGIDEGALLRASLWAYGAPLAGMLGGALFAAAALQAHDALVAAFAGAGLLAGLVGARAASLRGAARWQPALLRRAEPAMAGCVRVG